MGQHGANIGPPWPQNPLMVMMMTMIMMMIDMWKPWSSGSWRLLGVKMDKIGAYDPMRFLILVSEILFRMLL